MKKQSQWNRYYRKNHFFRFSFFKWGVFWKSEGEKDTEGGVKVTIIPKDTSKRVKS